jgi:hypothetical protein
MRTRSAIPVDPTRAVIAGSANHRLQRREKMSSDTILTADEFKKLCKSRNVSVTDKVEAQPILDGIKRVYSDITSLEAILVNLKNLDKYCDNFIIYNAKKHPKFIVDMKKKVQEPLSPMIRAATKLAQPKEFKIMIRDIRDGYAKMVGITAGHWNVRKFEVIKKEDEVFSPMIKTLKGLATESLKIVEGGKGLRNIIEKETEFFRYVVEQTEIVYKVVTQVAPSYYGVKKDFEGHNGSLTDEGAKNLKKLQMLVEGIYKWFIRMDAMAQHV